MKKKEIENASKEVEKSKESAFRKIVALFLWLEVDKHFDHLKKEKLFSL